MTIRSFFEHHPSLGDDCYVDQQALVLGQVQLGDQCSVWPMAVLRGDMLHITVGARSNIQDGCILHVTHDSSFCEGGSPLRIGEDVTVGHNAVVHACRIGNRVIVGMNATVLDEAVVEDDVIIGAGAVVAPQSRLESGYLYLGAPARKIKKLSDEQRALLPYSAANYVKLAAQYREAYPD